MFLNNNYINEKWALAKFKNAEAFVASKTIKHWIEKKKCTREEAILFYNQLNSDENKGVQQQSTKAKLSGGSVKSNSKEEGNN